MLGEPELQGETTNLQTTEGMILTPKDGKIDARGFMRKRKKVNLQDTANLSYCYAKVDWTMLKIKREQLSYRTKLELCCASLH